MGFGGCGDQVLNPVFAPGFLNNLWPTEAAREVGPIGGTKRWEPFGLSINLADSGVGPSGARDLLHHKNIGVIQRSGFRPCLCRIAAQIFEPKDFGHLFWPKHGPRKSGRDWAPTLKFSGARCLRLRPWKGRRTWLSQCRVLPT